jgi:5-methylcytosine-specific restriction endonuclease McrBC GTP-binding regulatory subunit McrB
MLSYKDYEKQVYVWLIAKHNKNKNFTFSLRQKGSKGAETDYFIGTEKSNYFSTTFWYLPVAFPGSSGDCIGLQFGYTKTGYHYFFEFTQTKEPHDKQNQAALVLVQQLQSALESTIGFQRQPADKNKMFTLRTKTSKASYETLKEMFTDIEKDMAIIFPIVDETIASVKKEYLEFKANRLTIDEFETITQKHLERIKRFENQNEDEVGIFEDEIVPLFEIKTQPLNQILYGPPGTGKTFNSINKALEIINEEEEKELNWKDRNAVKNLFDKRVDEGRIVFTTFHQSISYEDFIEGIKPEEPEKEGDPVIYKIKYGILRNQCIEACFDIAQLREDSVTEQVLDFSFRYDKFVSDTEEKLIAGETVKLKIKKGARVLVDSISQNGNVVIKHIGGNRTYSVSKNRLTKLNSAIKELNDITNIANEFKAIIGGSNSSAYWAVLNEVRNEGNSDTKRDKKIKYTFEEKNEVVSSLSKTDYSNKNGKPFVLIVDEINRGNVSQIFGELITLIEEDKRLGKEEALEVTLPYSKDKFGVPANLYIIGTMNTADRSVEALDAALRRRFHFEEMKPKPHLIKTESKSGKVNGVVDGIDLETLLTTINTRIEKLIDKDHRIGHSYFLKVNDSASLLHSFKNEIIPLLEEYFFGDFGKIGLVLGSSFVEKVNGNFSFAKFEEYDNDIQEDLKQRTVYKIKEESEWKFSEI